MLSRNFWQLQHHVQNTEPHCIEPASVHSALLLKTTQRPFLLTAQYRYRLDTCRPNYSLPASNPVQPPFDTTLLAFADLMQRHPPHLRTNALTEIGWGHRLILRPCGFFQRLEIPTDNPRHHHQHDPRCPYESLKIGRCFDQ